MNKTKESARFHPVSSSRRILPGTCNGRREGEVEFAGLSGWSDEQRERLKRVSKIKCRGIRICMRIERGLDDVARGVAIKTRWRLVVPQNGGHK